MVYPSAPIREALIDIKIDKLSIDSVEDLLKFKEFVLKDFPVERKRQNVVGTLQIFPDKPIESRTQSDLLGYVFLSKDSTRQIQVRIDGFTLNILRPYEKWETHFEMFMALWKEYVHLFKPNNVLRIASRYINRIELPLTLNDFQEYITNMPPIPPCLPQTYANFFMQVQVPCEDNFRYAIITETIEPADDKSLPFILDIDIFQEINIDGSEKNLRDNFAEIRKIKNSIFESCITNKTRELFK